MGDELHCNLSSGAHYSQGEQSSRPGMLLQNTVRHRPESEAHAQLCLIWPSLVTRQLTKILPTGHNRMPMKGNPELGITLSSYDSRVLSAKLLAQTMGKPALSLTREGSYTTISNSDSVHPPAPGHQHTQRCPTSMWNMNPDPTRPKCLAGAPRDRGKGAEKPGQPGASLAIYSLTPTASTPKGIIPSQ